MPEDGSDFTESRGTWQDINEIKNHYRGPDVPSAIQEGMQHSRSTDDRLIQRASAGQNYLIFQGEPLCMDNEVLVMDNEILVCLPV